MNKIEKRPEDVGTKLFKIIACSVFFVFSVFQSYQVFATEGVPSVTISVDDQGKTIILSDGKILDISAGDGWRTFNLSSGVKIAAFIDPVTDAASIKIYTGMVEVTSGGQTVTVQQGQETTASPGGVPSPPHTPPAPLCCPSEPSEPPPEAPHSPYL